MNEPGDDESAYTWAQHARVHECERKIADLESRVKDLERAVNRLRLHDRPIE